MPGKTFQSNTFVVSGLFGLLIVHILGIVGHWYAIYPPLGAILHFSGGFIVACITLWFLARRYPPVMATKRTLPFFLLIVGIAVLIGVFWEFIEFILDHSHVIAPLPSELTQP